MNRNADPRCHPSERFTLAISWRAHRRRGVKVRVWRCHCPARTYPPERVQIRHCVAPRTCAARTSPAIGHDGRVRWRSRHDGHISRQEELATALAAAGLWAGLPSRDGARLRGEVAQGASPVTGLAERGWRADGEDLAEGYVEELLRSMTDALRRCRVSLAVESVRSPHDDGSSGYTLRLNGALLDLFDYHPAEPGMPLTADPWMDCTVKPLGLVNGLLDEAGSSDRVAVFYAGSNDGLAVLLPLEAIQLLAASELIPERDRPVVPAAVR